MSKKIGVIVGSLRKGSFSRSIAKAAVELAPADYSYEFVEIGDLPLYNEDLDAEGQVPAAWTRFRKQIGELDGYLFVTPEYNRSIPAAIKNALDVGSRPYGASQWNGKPGAIISVTPGGFGAFGANHHLRQPMVFLNVAIMQQPEAYISNVTQCLDENGQVTNEKTREVLANFMQAFTAWVKKISA